MREDNCVFCGISKTLNSHPNLIREGEYVFLIPDINPVSKGHALVITKEHYPNFSSTSDEALKEANIFAKEYAQKLRQEDPLIQGFNFISNEGAKAKQIIFHFHLHIIPRY